MQRTMNPAGNSPGNSAGAPAEGEISLVGLWMLLVDNEGQLPTNVSQRVPMMVRAGNDQTFLLCFKNMSNARRFLKQSEIDGPEPRMIVKGNKDVVLQIARDAGVAGVLVDYNPVTQEYGSASALP